MVTKSLWLRTSASGPSPGRQISKLRQSFSTYKVIEDAVFGLALFAFSSLRLCLLSIRSIVKQEKSFWLENVLCYYLNKINIQFPSMPCPRKKRNEEREIKINSILDPKQHNGEKQIKISESLLSLLFWVRLRLVKDPRELGACVTNVDQWKGSLTCTLEEHPRNAPSTLRGLPGSCCLRLIYWIFQSSKAEQESFGCANCWNRFLSSRLNAF